MHLWPSRGACFWTIALVLWGGSGCTARGARGHGQDSGWDGAAACWNALPAVLLSGRRRALYGKKKRERAQSQSGRTLGSRGVSCGTGSRIGKGPTRRDRRHRSPRRSPCNGVRGAIDGPTTDPPPPGRCQVAGSEADQRGKKNALITNQAGGTLGNALS